MKDDSYRAPPKTFWEIAGELGPGFVLAVGVMGSGEVIGTTKTAAEAGWSLLLLILICFTLGGGKSGVIMAVALTHWPRLALILRAEAERVAHSDYLTLTWRLGHGHFYCWRHHYLPALLPQWLTGTLLMLRVLVKV